VAWSGGALETELLSGVTRENRPATGGALLGRRRAGDWANGGAAAGQEVEAAECGRVPGGTQESFCRKLARDLIARIEGLRNECSF
jgi:hypothetical protein